MADILVAKIDLTAWRDLLKTIQSKGRNIAGILKAVFGTIGFRNLIEHFNKEEGPDGKWKARSPGTQLQYALIEAGKRKPPRGTPAAAYNPSNKILQLTGALRGSILPSNVENITQSSILIFSNSKYGGKHDRGEDKMPKRTFMWFSQETLDRMAAASVQMWSGA